MGVAIDTMVEMVTEHNQTKVTVTLHSNIPSSRRTGEVLSAVTIEAVSLPDDEADTQYPLCCLGCQHRHTASFSLTVEEAKTLASGMLQTGNFR